MNPHLPRDMHRNRVMGIGFVGIFAASFDGVKKNNLLTFFSLAKAIVSPGSLCFFRTAFIKTFVSKMILYIAFGFTFLGGGFLGNFHGFG